MAISQTSSLATTALSTPITIAINERISIRFVAREVCETVFDPFNSGCHQFPFGAI